ncbi:MAG: hypothetical protein HY889_00455 [Deltaproteobacteria bacterium]|nr:hypothetical protein [Deltaproteobacteria bacterium]
MADEKDIKIVIRAEDEFSSVMDRAAASAEGTASRIKGAFYSTAFSENTAGLNDYSTGLKKVMELESARSEERKRSRAEMALDRLEENSPYKPAGKGPERIYLDYQRRLEALQAYNTAVINESIRAGDAQERIESEYTDLSLSYAAKRRDFQIGAAAETFGAAANALQNLFVATDSKHRAIFETMKAFAIAQTIIDTYKGATAAYAAMAGIPVIGPALGTAAAAATIAAGLARVAQIRGTHPGGGSISAEGHANPLYSGGSPSAYPVPVRLEEKTKPSQNITIQIYNPLSTQNWSEIVENDIIPALNNAADRNISVTVRNM